MQETQTTRARGGVSLATTLFLIFLVLRLTDNISWSWVWVTSPLWISLGLAVVIFVCTVIALSMVSKKTR